MADWGKWGVWKTKNCILKNNVNKRQKKSVPGVPLPPMTSEKFPEDLCRLDYQIGINSSVGL